MTAFILGFYPAAGLDYLVRRTQEFTIKRPHPDAAALRHTLPLDMIDGLTDFVRFRLEELEYEDVQNLATANPVLLYVETPYNILQIIDWIAQAQLITAVGPKKVLELRRINVRTIFDLARIGDSNHFRRCALEILVEPESLPRQRRDRVGRRRSSPCSSACSPASPTTSTSSAWRGCGTPSMPSIRRTGCSTSRPAAC